MKNKTCKIEGLSAGQWDESSVGNDTAANTFATREAAEKEIPELAKAFDCPESDFRVVERK
jgi:hypothetical protein